MKTTRLKRIETQRSVSKIVALASAVLILFIFIYGITKLKGFYSKIHVNGSTVKVNPEKTTYNILLLGYGGGKHEGTYLTDTIMVAHVDLKQHKALLISLPRDLWVKVPGKTEPFHSKINAAYEMGLFPQNYEEVPAEYSTPKNPTGLIKAAVKEVTGLTIDNYVTIDFAGFTKVVDTLGGIDVFVDRAFTDYEYPIEGKEADTCDKKDEELEDALKEATKEPVLAFPCRYETLTFTTGQTHLDGATALKFARSRHALDDGGDFNRAARQQKVVDGVKAKMVSIGFIPKIIPLMDDLSDHIKTDIDISLINKFLLEAPQASKYEIKTFVAAGDFIADGYSDYGQYILLPAKGVDKWEDIRAAVKKLLSTPTPSIVPTKK